MGGGDSEELLALTMVGFSALGTLHYGMRHRDIADDYMSSAVAPVAEPNAVANLPLRSFVNGTSYSNFNETDEVAKEDREDAIVKFMRTVKLLHDSGSLDANFNTDTNASAGGTPWWQFRHRLQTLFPDSEERWLPVSFMLAGTERANHAQYLFHGGVKSLVVETDVDLFTNMQVNIDNAAFKITFTLVDTNWRNIGKEGAPKEFSYVCNQDNARAVTSALLDAGGAALPIFVSSFGFRLERAPVDYATDVWRKFRMQGVGLEVNRAPTEDPLNPVAPALASVRFHENSGGKLTFIMRALPLLFKHSVTTKWNEQVGSIYVHSITPADPANDGLPLILHVNLDKHRIGMARVGTAIEMREPGDLEWDGNAVKSLAFETVDRQHEFVLDTTTGDWYDRNPVSLQQVTLSNNTAIDLVVLRDLLGRKAVLPALPAHGTEVFENFETRSFTRGQNFGLEEYNQVHAYNPTMSVFELESEINHNWWAWVETGVGTWLFVFAALSCLMLGWIAPGISRLCMKAGRLLALPVLVVGVVYLVMMYILTWTEIDSAFVLYSDKILYYGGLAVSAVTALYFLLCSRFVGAPPAQFVIAVIVLATATGLARLLKTNGRKQVLTKTVKTQFGVWAATAALACFVIALTLRQNSAYPMDSGYRPSVSFVPGGVGGMLNLKSVLLLGAVIFMGVYVIHGWDRECERAKFVKQRALNRANTPGLSSAASQFYRKEYFETEECQVNSQLVLGCVILGAVGLVWIFGPVVSSYMSRLFLSKTSNTPAPEDRGPDSKDGGDVTEEAAKHDNTKLKWLILVGIYVLLVMVLSKVIPDSKALERGDRFTGVCEDARVSLEQYKYVYDSDFNFDSVAKKDKIIEEMTGLECLPGLHIIFMLTVLAFVLLWITAVTVKERKVEKVVNVWASALFTLVVCLLAYGLAWLHDDDKRIGLLSVNLPKFINQILIKLQPQGGRDD